MRGGGNTPKGIYNQIILLMFRQWLGGINAKAFVCLVFKGFCKVFLHKLILKTAFLGLGWAQVYRSQLGPPLFLGGGRGGGQTNYSNIYAPYTYISLIPCLNQCFKLLNLFLAPDEAEDASADAAADINNSLPLLSPNLL